MSPIMPAMFLIVPVVLVVLVGGGALVLALRSTRGGRPPIASRRPRQRHMVTRIVCGALAAGIVIAVCLSTLRTAHGLYEDEAQPVTLRLPTKPAPQLPDQAEDPAPMKLLFHAIVAQEVGGALHVVHAQALELSWPKDRHAIKKISTSFHDHNFQWQVQINGFDRRRSSDATAVLKPRGTRSYSLDGPGYSSSSSGFLSHVAIGRPEYRHPLNLTGRAENPPLSLTSRAVANDHLFMILHYAQADDPLKETDATAWINGFPEATAKAVKYRAPGNLEHDRNVPAAVRLVFHGGAAGLLLLVAAVLTAQLFRRRGPAFAGALLAAVLFTVGLDRAVLGIHAEHAAASAPTARRLLAAAQARRSFYFRKTADELVQRVVYDAEAP